MAEPDEVDKARTTAAIKKTGTVLAPTAPAKAAEPAAKPADAPAPMALGDKKDETKTHREFVNLTHPDRYKDDAEAPGLLDRFLREKDPQKRKEMLAARKTQLAKSAEPSETQTVKALPLDAKKNVEREVAADQGKAKLPPPSILRSASKTVPGKPDEKAAGVKGAAVPDKTGEPAEPRTAARSEPTKVESPRSEPKATEDPKSSTLATRTDAVQSVTPPAKLKSGSKPHGKAAREALGQSDDPAHQKAHDLVKNLHGLLRGRTAKSRELLKVMKANGYDKDRDLDNMERAASSRAATAAGTSDHNDPKYQTAFAAEVTKHIHDLSKKHNLGLHPADASAETPPGAATLPSVAAAQDKADAAKAGISGAAEQVKSSIAAREAAAKEAAAKAEAEAEAKRLASSYNPPLHLMIQEWLR